MIGARRFFVVAASVLLLLLASGASAVEVFTIGPVPVDATAATATAARDAARADGQRKALRLLFERLVPSSDLTRLPRVDDATLVGLVQDFSVAAERSSATRYLADYTIRFRPEEVRRLLRQGNVPFAETASKPVIVLPVLTRGGGSVLWDSPNPWRDAWGNRKGVEGLVPFQVPTGELADVAAVDAGQAIAGDAGALDRIAALYGDGDVLVAQAMQPGEGEVRTLTTTTTRFGSTRNVRNPTQSWRANSGESETDFLARVANAVARDVEEAWKQDNLLRFGQEATLTAIVPIAALEDWIAVRDRLTGIAAIRRADLVSLSRVEARIEIRYVGDANQLRLALGQRDLQLVEGTPYWTVRRRSGAKS